MIKNCTQCKVAFEITDEDLKAYDRLSPTFDGKKFSIPTPKMCPACRMQRRMAFRNERRLYKAKCAFSGVEMLSVFPPDTGFVVYDQKIWWSDKWDELSYAKDFNFTRPFFEQFEELLKIVPRINLQNRNNENSEYCNDSNDVNNCYLCFNTGPGSEFYYCNTIAYGSDCMDLFWSVQIELCYESAKLMGAYHCFWCVNCSGVSDCYFSEDLLGCKNCFACIALRQKEYCVFNEQLSREKYGEFIKNFSFSYSEIEVTKKKFAEFRLKYPHRAAEISECENCTGNYLNNSKNCFDCFDLIQSENSRYIWDGMVTSSYDCFNVGFDTTFLYECVGSYRMNNSKFCDKCSISNDLMYCDYCFTCHDCFGCVGLRHKSYCILNKQYTREEYEKMLPRIIEHLKLNGEYGEFFPINLSPFGYNDTVANWDFPLSREEALSKGFKWNDYVNPKIGLKTIAAKDLAQNINQVGNSICTEIIECENDGKLFKIISKELEFYRKHNLPLPHFCPDCRHEKRKRQLNSRKMYGRKCDSCGLNLMTTYAPEGPEKIYCEKCYLAQVY